MGRSLLTKPTTRPEGSRSDARMAVRTLSETARRIGFQEAPERKKPRRFGRGSPTFGTAEMHFCDLRSGEGTHRYISRRAATVHFPASNVAS